MTGETPGGRARQARPGRQRAGSESAALRSGAAARSRERSAASRHARCGCPAGSKCSASTPTTAAAIHWSAPSRAGSRSWRARSAADRRCAASIVSIARRAASVHASTARRSAGAARAAGRRGAGGHRLAPLRGDDVVRRLHAQLPGRRRSAPTSSSPATCRAPPGMSSSSALMVGLAVDAGRARRTSTRGPSGAATFATPAGLGGLLRVHRERPVVRRPGRRRGGRAPTAAARITSRSSAGAPVTLSAWRFVPDSATSPTSRFPPDWTFVIASSGVAANKTGGAREAYNRLSRVPGRCSISGTATSPPAIAPRGPDIRAIRPPARLRWLVRSSEEAGAGAALERRLTHFLHDEDARVSQVLEAVRTADCRRLTVLSDESQG